MMKATKAVDYGLKACLYLLAQKDPKKWVPVRKMCSTLKLRRAYLLKVLKLLEEAKMIEIQRGAFGGYRLKKTGKDISFMDMVVAIDGPVEISDYIADPKSGRAGLDQKIREAWVKIQKTLTDSMSKMVLADLKPEEVVKD